MPIIKSAKKALRSSKRKKLFNDRRKRVLKKVTKDIEGLAKENKIDDAKKLLNMAYKAIDKAAKGGVIKKNTASRKKARMARLTRVQK